MKKVALLAALAWFSTAMPLWADCKMGRLGELKPVIAHSRIYVPGKVNGKEVLFMVDSGADTLLFAAEAVALGIPVGGYSGESFGATGGVRSEGQATLASLEIGLWSGHDVALLAVGSVGGENLEGVPVIGVLGEDILSHFDVEIDVKSNRFSLLQMTGCEDANLAYWTENYNVVDIGHYDARSPRLRLAGTLNDSPVSMILDTGAPFSAVSLDVARALGVSPGAPGVEEIGKSSGVNGQAETTWVGSFSSFALDQERIAPARIRFFKFAQMDPENGSHLSRRAFAVDMFLGFDFIRAHHVLISHSQKKFYFSYSGGNPFPVPKPSNPAQ
jgi:predicted aspartyl protease